MAQATEIGADLIIGTDPDCDRVGVVVRNAEGEFEVLSGNQTGVLLLHYILSEREKRGLLPKGATMVKTIVTSEMGRAVAAKFGVDTIDTLTGFKYIGEQIRLFEESGERTFLFGYEESYGYLGGTFVRDKDGVMATMQIAEMAAFYRQQGVTLYEALQNLYREFGYYKESLVSRTLKGIDGMRQMQEILAGMQKQPPVELGAYKVAEVRDYTTRTLTRTADGSTEALALPQENVLHYTLEDGSWFCLRPSGTEPKIKFYFSMKGATETEANAKLEEVQELVLARIE